MHTCSVAYIHCCFLVLFPTGALFLSHGCVLHVYRLALLLLAVNMSCVSYEFLLAVVEALGLVVAGRVGYSRAETQRAFECTCFSLLLLSLNSCCKDRWEGSDMFFIFLMSGIAFAVVCVC